MTNRNWIVVASAAHARLGRAGGFVQVGHGKAAPLHRLQRGDRVTYYSPTVELGGKDRLQAFTALGIVSVGEPYQFDMGGGFQPFRRDVRWLAAREAPIQPLLSDLDFTAGKRSWGSQLRFGLFPISDHDMLVIAAAMGTQFPTEDAA